MKGRFLAGTVFVLAFLWVGLVYKNKHHTPRPKVGDVASAIVLPPAAQVVMYLGDPFVAANVEAIRAVTSLGSLRNDEALFRLRAHEAVSRLNPCHEDNYWIGNAELTWGGSEKMGLKLLDRAMNCRTWDQWPAFFYGFNQNFFYRNVPEAAKALEIAAQRADSKNALAFRNLAIMMRVSTFNDLQLARNFLERERDNARDEGLRKSLDLRVRRLDGLIALRDAQAKFERKTGRVLIAPDALVSEGILDQLPKDPLGLGYAFVNGTFQLVTRSNPGLEQLRK